MATEAIIQDDIVQPIGEHVFIVCQTDPERGRRACSDAGGPTADH